MTLKQRDAEQYLKQVRFSGAIFDLDGVIVDTARYHYLAWRELSNKLGFDFTQDDNEQLKGVSRKSSLKILLEIGGISLDESAFEQALKEKNERYLTYINNLDKSEILPGVECYLTRLRSLGVRIALGSASKNASLILKRLRLTQYFDGIADGNCTRHAKPNPEVFLVAARQIGTKPKHCVVYEDSKAGIKAANRAGMFSVGIGENRNLDEADIVIPGVYFLV